MVGPINGHVVKMNTTNPFHYNEKNINRIASDDVSGSFQQVFMSALNKVNNLQVDSEELTQKMIYEPETVDIHQVSLREVYRGLHIALPRGHPDNRPFFELNLAQPRLPVSVVTPLMHQSMTFIQLHQLRISVVGSSKYFFENIIVWKYVFIRELQLLDGFHLFSP